MLACIESGARRPILWLLWVLQLRLRCSLVPRHRQFFQSKPQKLPDTSLKLRLLVARPDLAASELMLACIESGARRPILFVYLAALGIVVVLERGTVDRARVRVI